MKKGIKHDVGKLQYNLIPPGALRRIAEVLTYGASKYSSHNWKGVESDRYVNAIYRHLEAARSGEELDPESGLPHLSHAAANLLFLLDRQDETGSPQFLYGGLDEEN